MKVNRKITFREVYWGDLFTRIKGQNLKDHEKRPYSHENIHVACHRSKDFKYYTISYNNYVYIISAMADIGFGKYSNWSKYAANSSGVVSSKFTPAAFWTFAPWNLLCCLLQSTATISLVWKDFGTTFPSLLAFHKLFAKRDLLYSSSLSLCDSLWSSWHLFSLRLRLALRLLRLKPQARCFL